jgi:hypothetical protein
MFILSLSPEPSVGMGGSVSAPDKSRSPVAENRPGPSNLGNVISQILLCKQITPDFRQEELCSITKDSQDVRRMVQDMQEFMPQQENNTGGPLTPLTHLFLLLSFLFVFFSSVFLFCNFLSSSCPLFRTLFLDLTLIFLPFRTSLLTFP